MNPLDNFGETLVVSEIPICDVLLVEPLLRVDSTQSYGENTKSPTQDLINFLGKIIRDLCFKKIYECA